MKDKENLHVNNNTVSEQEISSVKFERFIDFMTRMIEKYGNDIDFSKLKSALTHKSLRAKIKTQNRKAIKLTKEGFIYETEMLHIYTSFNLYAG